MNSKRTFCDHIQRNSSLVQNIEKKYRSLPVFLKVAGGMLRNTPRFRGKDRIRRWIGNGVRGKGYSTTISFDRGESIFLDLDDWIPYLIFLYGTYYIEHIETMFFRTAVQEGMTILDIGAHIGYYTLQAAVRVKCSGHVHAFEPARNTFKILTRNVSMNGLTNVTTNNCAVANHCGIADIYIANNSNTGTSGFRKMDSFSGRTEKVDVLTIEEYINRKRLNKIDLVKIDTEGAELSVLKGMQNLLESECGPTIFIELSNKLLRPQNANSEEIFTFLKDRGYKAYKITKSGPVPVDSGLDANMVMFQKQV